MPLIFSFLLCFSFLFCFRFFFRLFLWLLLFCFSFLFLFSLFLAFFFLPKHFRKFFRAFFCDFYVYCGYAFVYLMAADSLSFFHTFQAPAKANSGIYNHLFPYSQDSLPHGKAAIICSSGHLELIAVYANFAAFYLFAYV